MTAKPDFDNASQWEIHRDINVFAEHSRTVTDRHGKKRTVKFTKDRLERVADKSNARDAKRQPCPLTLGHTDDERPEDEQPDIVGYARNFKVAYDARLKKWVVRADYYLRKEDAGRAKKFPRTSVEVWDRDEFFDPIALLKRTPQLDLGQWTYGRGGGLKLRYSMDDFEPDADRDHVPDEAEREEGTDPRDPDTDDDGVTDAADPVPGGEGEDKGPGGLSHPAAWHDFKKCMAHHGKSKQYGMGDGGVAGGAAAPGPTNGRVPKPKKAEEPERMRKTPEDLRYEKLEKTIGALTSEIRAIREDRDTLIVRNQRADAREEIRAALPGKIYDLETEVDLYLSLSPEKRPTRLRYLKQTLVDDPTAGKEIRLQDGKPSLQRYGKRGEEQFRVSGGSESGREADGGLSDDQTDKVLAYMRDRGLSGDAGWHEAKQHVLGNGKGK